MEGSRTYPETSGLKIGHWESCQTRMKFVLRFVAASAGLLLLPQELPGAAVGAEDPCSYVDPFIGTDGGGNVVPGPCLPFGMVKLSPDCDLDFSNSGYVSGRPILGFSHTHVSGTGGGPKYGNILVMATTGEPAPGDHASPAADEMASPGFLGVTLTRFGIKAALTATRRTGFHQYTFPATTRANVLIDAGSFLGQHYAHASERQMLVGSEVRILNDTTMEGYSRVRGGWNAGDAYTVFFYAVFDTPATAFGTWKNGRITPGGRSEFDSGEPSGAFFTFDPRSRRTVRVKVGISYLGCEKARHNLEQENPSWDFEAVRRSAAESWRQALHSITVEGGDQALKRMFTTALYHTMLMPVDKTGENPRWSSGEPYYDDFYAIWDTFRTSHPLLTLLKESVQRDMVRSLIDTAEHDGYLPDARSGDCNGRTQGGSNADIVIADAGAKELPGIDYTKALRAIRRDAEVPPGGDERKEGRGGLADYRSLGYVSTAYERSGSRTIEYAYDDWAIAQVARKVGDEATVRQYLQRAGNWKNLWRPVTDHGATGFIMPRRADGTWVDAIKTSDGQGEHVVPFTVLSAGSWNDVFYESHSWEYSFFVPHDVRALIEGCGGREAFVARLDTFFREGFFHVDNEPGFLTPLLYVYAGRPDKTSAAVVHLRQAHYNDTRSGLPGNDDSGAMSSLFVFHCLGFFPNAGQDVYLISSPAFDRAVVRMENGREVAIIAHGVSRENIYIQSATLNGQPLDRAWFRHAEIRQGATLEFQMGPKPSAWGVATPPSASDGAPVAPAASPRLPPG
jgi:predicted alpha-1,2-mannosidase